MHPRLLRLLALACWMAVVHIVSGCSSGKSDVNPCLEGLPQELPFAVERAPTGDPVSDAEITAFTEKITGFWKQTNYFQWILDTNHGVDASTGLPDWMVWWTGVEVIKSGGQITFHHSETGGPDNIMIPTSRVLRQVMDGYLLTGDPVMGQIVEQFCRGITATMLGMVWNAQDPVRSIMARAVITNNQTVTLSDGRPKAIDYSAWRQLTQAWNSHTIHNPDNPSWGDIYVKNMRSKDDIPHLFTTTALLPYVAKCGKDEKVRAAAAEAFQYMQGFGKDIVDSGYHIRTKDEDGNIFTPTEDLASFVDFEYLDPNAECNAKISAAFLGYGDNRGLDCKDGSGGSYESASIAVHYYNEDIIRNFHLSAILHSIMNGQSGSARKLADGLVARIDNDLALPDDQLPTGKDEWEADLAVYALQASASGLPLTWREVRLIHSWYGQAVDSMLAFQYWNLWDPSIRDGTYNYRPDFTVDVADMAFFLEHCYSPFRNPNGSKVVDCDIVKDPKRWGGP